MAGNLEHKSGLLAAIMGEDDVLDADDPEEPGAEQAARDRKVVPFPSGRGRR